MSTWLRYISSETNATNKKAKETFTHLKLFPPLPFMLFCVKVSEISWLLWCSYIRQVPVSWPFGLAVLSSTLHIAWNFALLCACSSDRKHLLQVILKSTAELVLSDTACDNDRKRDVYCRLSTPFILAQKLHRVPALPPVHTTVWEALPTQASGQAAREVAFVLGRGWAGKIPSAGCT